MHLTMASDHSQNKKRKTMASDKKEGKMAESAVSLVIQNLIPLFVQERNCLMVSMRKLQALDVKWK